MDSLFSRLLLRTSELRDPRSSLSGLGPTILNLCFHASETGQSTRDFSSDIYVFDDANMQKNVLLLENLQASLNGSLSSIDFPPSLDLM